jgi:hypothetical protein
MKAARRARMELHSLPGIRGGRLYAVTRHSITSIIDALKWHRCVVDARDHDTVIVYRDDNGNWRCLFKTSDHTISAEIFALKKQANHWLTLWHPKQRAAA